MNQLAEEALVKLRYHTPDIRILGKYLHATKDFGYQSDPYICNALLHVPRAHCLEIPYGGFRETDKQEGRALPDTQPEFGVLERNLTSRLHVRQAGNHCTHESTFFFGLLVVTN